MTSGRPTPPTARPTVPCVDRVVLVGGPGSGKSTLGARISRCIGAPHVELDGLFWLPDWEESPAEEFVARVTTALPADGRWVADGNYLEILPELLWARADTLVWLDLPRRLALRRALLRTVRRLASRRVLWGTNKETLSVLRPASLRALWLRWPSYHDRIEALLERPPSTLTVVQLRSPGDVEGWMETLKSVAD